LEFREKWSLRPFSALFAMVLRRFTFAKNRVSKNYFQKSLSCRQKPIKKTDVGNSIEMIRVSARLNG
jgi:hypothetical protein